MRFTKLPSPQRLKRTIVLLFVTCALVTVIWGAQSGGATDASQAGERQMLRSLLDEVHQLRLVLQRSHLTTTRAQLAFERMRLQRGRVDALLRECESVRAQLAAARDALSQASDRVKEMEELTGQTNETALRARFERQLSMSKQILSAQTRREEQLRERDVQLNAQLHTEQAKLSELEDQLGNLERELSAP